MTTLTTGTLRTEQWRERIAQQAASGKSVAAFCQEQGIATQTFYWWRNRVAKRESEAGLADHQIIQMFQAIGKNLDKSKQTVYPIKHRLLDDYLCHQLKNPSVAMRLA